MSRIKKCRNCGREEFGYGFLLNEDGYCQRCFDLCHLNMFSSCGYVSKIDEQVQKMHILEKRLKIATKALKKYMTFCRHPAEEALKEMEGVK